MRILVLGCGSIGKRHIRNLLSMNIGEVAAFDTNTERLNAVKDEFSIRALYDLNNGLDDFSAAFICSPPSFHVTQALQLVNMGVHCFIEKPLAKDITGVDELIELSNKKKKVVFIGYTIRYSYLFNKMKEMIDNKAIGKILFLKASIGYYLPYWRPSEDYRKGYGAKAELGGGILLDASHEIDYIRCLAGEVIEVSSLCKKLSNLEIDTEDFAEITMHHKNGIYSQIHLDYLQSNYRRSCEVVGDNGMLIWDLNKREINHYTLNDKEFHVYREGLNADSNTPYIEEAKHFFRCIQGLEKPLICLKEGKRVQEILLKIKESSDVGQTLMV